MRKSSNDISTDQNEFRKAIQLLHLAKQDGIDILLAEGELQLKLHQDKEIPETLLVQIKDNKQLIIDFLSNSGWKSKRVNENHNKVNRLDRNLGERIPLSFSQERLWFIDRLEGSVQYHIPTVLRLQGKLNRKALEFALKNIVIRHEVLRTVILEEEGNAFQLVQKADEWQFNLVDGEAYKKDAAGLQQYIEQLIKEPFDLSKDYMLRASLVALEPDEHVLVIALHHIASDAWSKAVLVKEVVELYSSYEEDRLSKLASLEVQYADFAVWQRHYLEGEVLEKKVSYWKNKLEDVGVLQLPTDHPRPAVQSTRGAITLFTINKSLTTALQSLSQQNGATVFMTLLAAFKVLLYRYNTIAMIPQRLQYLHLVEAR